MEKNSHVPNHQADGIPAPPFSDPYFDGENAEKSPEASCGMSNFLSTLSGGSASSKGADESAGSDGFQGESPVKRTQTNQTMQNHVEFQFHSHPKV